MIMETTLVGLCLSRLVKRNLKPSEKTYSCLLKVSHSMKSRRVLFSRPGNQGNACKCVLLWRGSFWASCKKWVTHGRYMRGDVVVIAPDFRLEGKCMVQSSVSCRYGVTKHKISDTLIKFTPRFSSNNNSVGILQNLSLTVSLVEWILLRLLLLFFVI